jgi:hypothetical protein
MSPSRRHIFHCSIRKCQNVAETVVGPFRPNVAMIQHMMTMNLYVAIIQTRILHCKCLRFKLLFIHN